MSILDTVKKGTLSFLTENGYQKFLPRTLASLVSMNNGTSVEDAVNGKAAASHGTHVTYSSTAPVMDGTASVGSASTVARSDHKHPTDTSRLSTSNVLNAVTATSSGYALDARQGKALQDQITELNSTLTQLNTIYLSSCSLMDWCNNHPKDGCQVLQITQDVSDTPIVYCVALYICSTHHDRRTITIYGHDGKIYMNTYTDTADWSGWYTINSYSDVSSWTILYSKYCRYKSSGGVVTVKGESNGEYTLTKGSYKDISTLPIGYRPTEPIYFTATNLGGVATVFGYVSTTGVIKLYTDSDSTNYWAYTCTFTI